MSTTDIETYATDRGEEEVLPELESFMCEIEFITSNRELIYWDTYEIRDIWNGFPKDILNLTFIHGDKRYGNWTSFVNKGSLAQPISSAIGVDLSALLWYNSTKGVYVTSLICSGPMATPFLTYDGVKYLWSQLSLDDYPNNETLIAVLNAIDKTKLDNAFTEVYVNGVGTYEASGRDILELHKGTGINIAIGGSPKVANNGSLTISVDRSALNIPESAAEISFPGGKETYFTEATNVKDAIEDLDAVLWEYTGEFDQRIEDLTTKFDTYQFISTSAIDEICGGALQDATIEEVLF